jgi:NADPH:quinone reductase-like Zn-dependent oxidoreductase
MATMQAVVHRRYGSPDVVELAAVEVPVIGDDQVLVRVHAVSVNPLDWHGLTGTPYVMRLQGGLRRPKQPVLGVDVAGTVEAVGAGVTRFRPGDEVFGGANGSFAELALSRERSLEIKPAEISFEQAAAIPVAGVTALQALRDKGHVQPGQHVLVNGAAGGVGTFAVQIAKALGAHVTGVCSTANVELVRSLGADHVIDYTRDDFARAERRYDVMIDNAGSRSLRSCKNVLSPHGVYVVVGGPKKGRLLGPLTRLAAAKVVFLTGGRTAAPFLAQLGHDGDLGALVELITSGKVTPVVDQVHPLADAAEALRQIGSGHTRGKVVLRVG